MAGRGPNPKDASTRARRNAKSTKTELTRTALRSVEDFSDLTVAELRATIVELNLGRPGDQQIDTRGRKAELAERIVAAESPIPTMPAHPPRWDEDAAMALPVDWHEQTVSWWNDNWTSPMVSAWDASDFHNVCVVALAYDDIWTSTSPRERKDAMAEFRQQCVRLGLDPISRARLQWTVETADEAQAKGNRRRQTSGQTTSAPKAPKADPRFQLVQ